MKGSKRPGRGAGSAATMPSFGNAAGWNMMIGICGDAALPLPLPGLK
jgi:hypothetical protein